VFQSNCKIYNYGRAIFGAMCHFRDLIIHKTINYLMAEEVRFVYEKLCFFKDDWKLTNALKVEDLVKVKKCIINSIQRSPAIAILDMLHMMSRKEKELKYLSMILQDYDFKGSMPMTTIELFNPKKKTHEMNLKNERVHLLILMENREYIWTYDTTVKELHFRQELLKLLMSKAIPDNIVVIIKEIMNCYPQWYTDHKSKGLASFMKDLEKSFRYKKVLVDIASQEKVIQFSIKLNVFLNLLLRPNTKSKPSISWMTIAPVKQRSALNRIHQFQLQRIKWN
jgi:hypothetical protein